MARPRHPDPRQPPRDDDDRRPLDERVSDAFGDLQELYREAQEWQDGLKAELTEADKLVARIERFMHNPPAEPETEGLDPTAKLRRL